ncbi:MAG: amylo-alpha-1,6-glucosidase [Candidatus Altiarchaeota archaeon]
MAIFQLKISEVGLERAKEIQWLITNSFGSYSSSSILNRTTKNYHGFFVSFVGDSRVIVIKSLNEYLLIQGRENYLSEKFLESFEYSSKEVKFVFQTNFAKIFKSIRTTDVNGVIATYEIKNISNRNLKFIVEVIVECKIVESTDKFKDQNFSLEKLNEKNFGIETKGCYAIVSSDNAICFFRDRKAHFVIELKPAEEAKFHISVICADSKEKATEDLKEIEIFVDKSERFFSSGFGSALMALLANSNQFLVKRDNKIGIIAGYPYYGEIGRDAMISLPGLTFITGKFKEAELIFERYLNNSTTYGVPSKFLNGEPIYEDIDTTLWLIDRLYKYMLHVGEENFKNFLHTYWWNLKDIMKSYLEKERNGFLMHNGKTWMFSLRREFAVEIQGLWYNALKIMDRFSVLMDDYSNYEAYAKDHEAVFLEKFWNGSYLKDSLDDNSLRPNQLILADLSFNLLSKEHKEKILEVISKELLTPYGVMTLSKKDENFNPYDKFDGAVIPWLLGPFVKMHTDVYGKEKSYEFLKIILEGHINSGCIGAIPEFFNSENYKFLGCVSYAPSVAEILRAYFEDILEKNLHKRAIYL